MKNQIIVILALLYVCHGKPQGTADSGTIDINNKSEPIPPITEVPKNDGTSTPSPTTKPTIITTTSAKPPTSTNGTTTVVPPPSTTSATTTTSPTPTTSTVKPTASPTTSTVSPSTSTSKPTPPTKQPSTTQTPKTSTVVPAPSPRKFDGPSFLGGVVLAAGLMAIAFVAFKFYKSREQNYHTL